MTGLETRVADKHPGVNPFKETVPGSLFTYSGLRPRKSSRTILSRAVELLDLLSTDTLFISVIFCAP